MKDFERVEIVSRAGFRRWLEANHARSEPIWLVTYKKAEGDRYVPYGDVVEEGLCFGWIDSRTRRLDERRTMYLFSPRRSGSAWSRSNKIRVERLEANDLMRDPGRSKIDEAKADGSWSFLDDVEALIVPDDLAAALDADSKARRHYDGFNDSSKKNILLWIKTAKRPETREKRIRSTVDLAARGLRANHPEAKL